MTLAPPQAGPPKTMPRIVGIDAARALALIGMMATHLIPLTTADGDETLAAILAEGRASALFATLAGVSLALGDGGATARSRPYPVMLLRVAVRALLIGLLGLVLAGAGTPILIILTYYALLFVLVGPLLRLPAWALAALAAVWVVAGPVLSHVIRRDAGPTGVFIESPSFGGLASDPGRVVVGLLLTGTYPAFTWLAYALAGAAVGRLRPSARTAAVLVGLGALLTFGSQWLSSALVARAGDALTRSPNAGGPFGTGRFYGTTPTDTWWWLAIDDPHSGVPLDLLGTIGSALLVIGVMLIVTVGRFSRVWVWLWSAGSMTLTLYSLHVLMFRFEVGFGDSTYQAWLIQSAIVLLVGLVWRRLFRRGPLEATVGRTVDAATPPPRAVRA